MRFRDGLLALGIIAVCCGLVVAVTYPAPTKTPPPLPIAIPPLKVKHEQEKVMKVVVTFEWNALDVRLVPQ